MNEQPIKSNDFFNTSDNNNEKKINKKGLLLTGLVVAVGLAAFFAINYLGKNEQGVVKVSDQFVLSREEIINDFSDEEQALGDINVPVEVQERYMEPINNALNAIKNNKPSSEDNKDLKEDYLTVASSYTIISEYLQAEEYYKKMIELWPDDYKANLGLGDLYAYMHYFQKAANKYYDTVIIYPGDFRIYGKLADLYLSHAIIESDLVNEKVDKIYDEGIKKANDPKTLYKEYGFFLENTKKDFDKALWAQKEYDKLLGLSQSEEVKRLEGLMRE